MLECSISSARKHAGAASGTRPSSTTFWLGTFARTSRSSDVPRAERLWGGKPSELALVAPSATLVLLAWSGGVASPELPEEPGFRGLPVPHDGLGRDVQDIRCFVDGQAAKESQLDNLAHPRIERRQSAERIAEGDKVALVRVWQLLQVIETHVNRTATAFLALPVAGGLHQDPSHHLRRHSEEVRAIPPFDSIDVDQPQVASFTSDVACSV